MDVIYEIKEIKAILKSMKAVLKQIKASQKEIDSLLHKIQVVHDDEEIYLQAIKLVLAQQRMLEERIEAIEWDLEISDEELN